MTTQLQSRLGRPKDTLKHDAIIKAAMELFALHPFDAVTMEAVAARAGVSKMTVYSHFVDKETLLENVVMAVSDQMTAALAGPAGGHDLRDRLVALGRAFLETLLGPIVSKMCGFMPGLMRGNRAMGQRFYAAGAGRTRAALVAIIEHHAQRGELTIDRAEWAADDLLSLWDGGERVRIACGVEEHLGPQEIERRANRAVDVFLRAYAAPVSEPHGILPGPVQ